MAIWDIKERNKKVRANEIRKNRALFGGGATPSAVNTIDYIDITVTGNATDFGDLVAASTIRHGGSSTTRAIFGGHSPSAANDSVQMESQGNAADFGDNTSARGHKGSSSNNIRVIWGGGDPGGAFANIIDYVNIATFGDAADFGNLSATRAGMYDMPSTPTRGFFVGGDGPSGGARLNIIEYITFASVGNATDFGDLSSATYRMSGTGSTTRAVLGGGRDPAITNNMETFEMTTLGNGTNFGDLTGTRSYMGATSNTVRAVFGGGYTPSLTNIIDYIQVVALGDAADFGDLTSARANPGGVSGGHGGIDQDVIQRPSVTYMPGSGRGLFGGGYTPSLSKVVNLTHIPTLGNSSNFGDLSITIGHCFNAASSYTRLVKGGGYGPAGNDNTIENIEMATRGNAADFGNLGAVTTGTSNISNSTRGLVGVGGSPTASTIEYVTITTAGNGTDFGDLDTAHGLSMGSVANSTRGIFGGGYVSPAKVNTVDYVTIASASDATDFGDLTVARFKVGSVESATIGVFMGGFTSDNTNVCDYITMASAGNATDFGDTSAARRNPAGFSNPTRGIIAGGMEPAKVNTMEYITIASTGNTTDFGDVASIGYAYFSGSDSHGGLQG